MMNRNSWRHYHGRDLPGTVSQSAMSILPVTLDSLKTHMRVTHAEEDSLIESLCFAAAELIESETDRIISPRSFVWRLPAFPSWDAAIVLPVVPVTAITSIKYDDTDEVEQTLPAADYVPVLDNVSAYVTLAFNATWPTTLDQELSVRVHFEAGHTTVPKAAEHCIKLLVAHWYENREAVGTVGQPIALSCNALMATLKSCYTVVA